MDEMFGPLEGSDVSESELRIVQAQLVGWPALVAANPALVMTSVTTFGQTGPYKDRAGYDFMLQGMGGMMAITGTPEEPMKVGVAI